MANVATDKDPCSGEYCRGFDSREPPLATTPAVSIPHATYRIVDCLTLLPDGHAAPCRCYPPSIKRSRFKSQRFADASSPGSHPRELDTGMDG